MMNKTAEFSYDTVPYPSYAYSQTHPDRLATLAMLSGMSPPPVTRCRVLELGCAGGGNLIPIAYSLPGSEFVGIDLSARQIADGQAAIRSLGLENVSLCHLDILDVDPDFGEFDYIIVYGIYSWVNELVQDKILDICRQNLAPNGVVYISYNVYPGWRMNTIIRDAMLYRTRNVTEPPARIKAAQTILEFLAESVPAEHSPYGYFLHDRLALLQSRSDAYLFHDFMEDVNEPLYFYQFVERAERHGLQYLANAEFTTPGNLSAELVTTVHEMTGDIIQAEQYIDFLNNRGFRQTLLCHQDVPLSRTPKPECLTTLRVASRIESVPPDLDIQSTQAQEFKGPDGITLSEAHPLTKAALLHLTQVWPQAVPFNTLFALARSMLASAAETEQDAHLLGTNLLRAYRRSINLVEFHTYVPHFVLEIGERPIASITARYQAQNEFPITNLYHQRIDMGEVSCRLLGCLDGSRDRAALLDVMVALEAEGILSVKQDDRLVEDVGLIRYALGERLDAILRQTRWAALLVG